MRTFIKNATSVLGQELMAVFLETYGDDEQALREIVSEAIKALKYARESFEIQTDFLGNDIEEAA
jgi:hypothetical protein